jgi:ubiquinone/menaquinone biosynthesis C-methylase UbiE
MNESTKFYNQIGPLYDLFDLVFLLGRKGHPRTRLASALAPQTFRLLDICVGTAATSMLVAKRHPQTQIIGIDLSAGMLSVAQRKIRKANIANLELQRMDACQTTFADGCFDGVMTSFALHEMEPGLREAIFAEVGRVLRPGGQFYLLDFGMQADRWTRGFLAAWGMLEPRMFREFLGIDWHTVLLKHGLRVRDKYECSFSNLYIAQRS